MTEQIYQLEESTGDVKFVKVTVDRQDDHFVASSLPCDARGNDSADAPSLAPKFYGVTQEQALRRMVEALENSYDEVTPFDAS